MEFSLFEAVFALFDEGECSDNTDESEEARLTDLGRGTVVSWGFGLWKPGVEKEGREPSVFLRTKGRVRSLKGREEEDLRDEAAAGLNLDVFG